MSEYKYKFSTDQNDEGKLQRLDFYELHSRRNVAYIAFREVSKNEIFIDGIRIDESHQGNNIGSTILQVFIGEKPTCNMRLKVDPFSNSSLSIEKLKKFYNKFHFKEDAENKQYMFRKVLLLDKELKLGDIAPEDLIVAYYSKKIESYILSYCSFTGDTWEEFRTFRLGEKISIPEEKRFNEIEAEEGPIDDFEISRILSITGAPAIIKKKLLNPS